MRSVTAGRLATAGARPLSETLEDYLEIILALSLEQRTVRVRDIARAKVVRTPSVTAALKRLAEIGLVRYEAREYVELSDEGSAAAARVAGRHRFLTRFLVDVLGIPPGEADADACSLEHRLSAATLERLAAFVEYLETCPEVGSQLLARFRECVGLKPKGAAACSACPYRPGSRRAPALHRGESALAAIADLEPGGTGEVARVRGSAGLRCELERRGILPGTRLTKVGGGGKSGGAVIRLQDRELRLSRAEARAIFVEPGEAREERADARA